MKNKLFFSVSRRSGVVAEGPEVLPSFFLFLFSQFRPMLFVVPAKLVFLFSCSTLKKKGTSETSSGSSRSRLFLTFSKTNKRRRSSRGGTGPSSSFDGGIRSTQRIETTPRDLDILDPINVLVKPNENDEAFRSHCWREIDR